MGDRYIAKETAAGSDCSAIKTAMMADVRQLQCISIDKESINIEAMFDNALL